VRPFDPVLAAAMGTQLEYGNLFVYLFRRVGYPNELARYLLSTRRADLFLGVVPRLDGRADLGLARGCCSTPRSRRRDHVLL